MAFFRPSLLAALVPVSLVACSSSPSPDPVIVPEGTHYHFVANKALVPTTNATAREYGLDLGASDKNVPDGTVDNQLGMVLGTLAGMGFKIQDTLDLAVNEGSIILLVDFQTKDLQSSSAAGLQVLLGDKTTAMPMPCNGSADTTCAHHLDGTGTFTIASNSPTNAALAGKIVGGVFTGGPGNITLQIALGGTQAITLNLIAARAKLTGVTDTTVGSAVLAGALTQDDLNTKVLPAIQQQLVPIIARDCTAPTMPPACGCVDGSTGKTILGLFDTTPKDCAVTVSEIQNNQLIKSLLAPDICSTASCVQPDALSLGIKLTAVKGTFTVAGQ
ncbi:MAG: hypothetical protein JWO36_727 [Myxococcales bacterium]|nr:hypothetical protein [Myxococcales bacterium]